MRRILALTGIAEFNRGKSQQELRRALISIC